MSIVYEFVCLDSVAFVAANLLVARKFEFSQVCTGGSIVKSSHKQQMLQICKGYLTRSRTQIWKLLGCCFSAIKGLQRFTVCFRLRCFGFAPGISKIQWTQRWSKPIPIANSFQELTWCNRMPIKMKSICTCAPSIVRIFIILYDDLFIYLFIYSFIHSFIYLFIF